MGLIFQIKKKIIYKNFLKKKKNNPMDLTKDELFVIPKDCNNEFFNNSYFFGGYHLSKDESLVLRIGYKNKQDCELFVLYKNKDLFLSTPKDYYSKQELPIICKCVKPGEEWLVKFNGQLIDKKTKVNHNVSFEFTWKARKEVYDFFYSLQNNAMIEAISKPKWNKQFFEEVATNDQRHYEQSGFMKGFIVIDGVKSQFEMPSGRDHSYGTRNWDYMNDHIWLLAFKENGEVFNYSLVNYPLLKNVNCGYCDFSRDKLASLKKLTSLEYDANDGKGLDTLKVQIKLTDGTDLDIKATRLVNEETHYQGGDYYFQEGIGVFTINGEKAMGSIEYGFNHNKDKWEIK